MRTTPQTQIIQRQPMGDADIGRAIQCRGCGEIGRAAWERGDSLQAAPHVTRLSGSFYLHHGQIACGRCQQIYRAD